MNHIPLLSLLLGADTAPYDAPACFELAGRHFDWSIPGSGGGTLSFDDSTLTIDGKKPALRLHQMRSGGLSAEDRLRRAADPHRQQRCHPRCGVRRAAPGRHAGL